MSFTFFWPPLTVFLQPPICAEMDQIFDTVLLFVLVALLWIFTLLTLKSLYKIFKNSLNLNRVVRTKLLAEKQMSLVLILMVVAFTFSLSPTLYVHIYYFALKFNYVDCENVKIFLNVNISKYFLSTNSIWNILVYNVVNKKFCMAFKALFK